MLVGNVSVLEGLQKWWKVSLLHSHDGVVLADNEDGNLSFAQEADVFLAVVLVQVEDLLYLLFFVKPFIVLHSHHFELGARVNPIDSPILSTHLLFHQIYLVLLLFLIMALVYFFH